MATHNTTKVLALSNQTKLTLTVTLTLNDAITVESLTPTKRLLRIYKRIISRRCVAGFLGGANNQLNRVGVIMRDRC